MWRVIFVCLLAAAGVCAEAAGPEGTWNSEEKFKGEASLVVVLKGTGGQLGGTVTMRGVTDDDNNATTLNLVIQSAVFQAEKLSFETKTPDDSLLQWEITFNGSNATAAIVGDQDGPYGDPQRWKLQRADH